MIRFFLSGKTAKYWSEILSFKTNASGELIPSLGLVQITGHYVLSPSPCYEVFVHTFIKWLEPNTKILLDSTTIGQALEKTL